MDNFKLRLSIYFILTYDNRSFFSPSFTYQNHLQTHISIMLALFQRILDWFRSLFWKEEMELTLVGLQYSGKTTFVNVIAVSIIIITIIITFYLLYFVLKCLNNDFEINSLTCLTLTLTSYLIFFLFIYLL